MYCLHRLHQIGFEKAAALSAAIWYRIPLSEAVRSIQRQGGGDPSPLLCTTYQDLITAGCGCGLFLEVVHAVCQDYALRWPAGSTQQQLLEGALRAIMHLLHDVADGQAASQRSAVSAALAQYAMLYAPDLDVKSDHIRESAMQNGRSVSDRCALSWCARAISSIGNSVDCKISAFNSPLLTGVKSCRGCPCPTMILTAAFLQYANHAAIWSAKQAATTAYWPRVMLDAFVYSLLCVNDSLSMDSVSMVREPNAHGLLGAILASQLGLVDDDSGKQFMKQQFSVKTGSNYLSLYTEPLQLMVQVAIPLCKTHPNPIWPIFLLKMVGRDDLCGEMQINLLSMLIRTVELTVLCTSSYHRDIIFLILR